jgi:hypothetical protein
MLAIACAETSFAIIDASGQRRSAASSRLPSPHAKSATVMVRRRFFVSPTNVSANSGDV